jgi:hypothetical protein
MHCGVWGNALFITGKIKKYQKINVLRQNLTLVGELSKGHSIL